jgi:hypothetical protein
MSIAPGSFGAPAFFNSLKDEEYQYVNPLAQGRMGAVVVGLAHACARVFGSRYLRPLLRFAHSYAPLPLQEMAEINGR